MHLYNFRGILFFFLVREVRWGQSGRENKQAMSFQLRDKEQRTKTATTGKKGQTDNPSVLGFKDILPHDHVWTYYVHMSN